jgi:hypothetical protein
MVTQIVIHLFPHEIDWFEWQIKQLKLGSFYLGEEDNIIMDVTLNLNLVNWDQSQLPKQFFITKFKQLEKLCDWCQTQFIIDEEYKCLGCNDKRREAIRSTKADNILYLDADLFFSPSLLKYIIEASKLIKHDYYVISPQTVRMWDTSWDIITNKNHFTLPPDLNTYYSNDPFQIISTPSEEIIVSPIERFKFAGGWFNLLSSKLLKFTDIPESLGSYGVDDTYVMICCDIMKQKGYKIQQYVLEDTVIIENFKYRLDPYKEYLTLTNSPREYQKIAENNLNLELKKFSNRI